MAAINVQNLIDKINSQREESFYGKFGLEQFPQNPQTDKEYFINVFYLECETIDELENKWEKFANDIAFFFQSELELDIEIWNIYIFYFVKECFSEEKKGVKYKIDNNTYSSRKFVIENEYKKTDIEKKLFDRIKLDNSKEVQVFMPENRIISICKSYINKKTNEVLENLLNNYSDE